MPDEALATLKLLIAESNVVDADLAKFFSALGEISPSSVCELLSLLDDKASSDLMFAIIHHVEQTEDRVYINKMAHCIESVLDFAPSWGSTIVTRILNNERSYLELQNFLSSSSAEKKLSVVKALKVVAILKPKFIKRIENLVSIS